MLRAVKAAATIASGLQRKPRAAFYKEQSKCVKRDPIMNDNVRAILTKNSHYHDKVVCSIAANTHKN